MESFSKIIFNLYNLLWSPIPFLSGIPIIGWLSPFSILLLGTGLWFSLELNFIQIRGFKKGINAFFSGLKSKSPKAGAHGMSSFQSLATAIASQVGTGNVVGVSTAIATGGPGAVFWMWLAAFFGMATMFVEAALAQRYKVISADGQVTGGPVYYIRQAFKGVSGKLLAIIFSLLFIIAYAFTGSAVQTNGISTAWDTVFNPNGTMTMVNILGLNVSIVQVIVGALVALLALLIFAGGISSIASFTEKIVPIMAILFIGGSLFVLVTHIGWTPAIISRIFIGAFNPTAVFGGFTGIMVKDAVSKGIARGLYSHEAGIGSTPHAHAVARVIHPTHQGYVAMIGVFVDTFIILNLTAFVVVGSGLYDPEIAGEVLNGAALAQAGFREGFGSFGNIFIAICLTFFAFSTIISSYFFGAANVRYLFGKRAIRIYAILFCACIFLGALQDVDLIWTMQDTFIGLAAVPNIISLLALTRMASRLADEDDPNIMLY
jgi:AGCS family alanine or glycine:cation symporter